MLHLSLMTCATSAAAVPAALLRGCLCFAAAMAAAGSADAFWAPPPLAPPEGPRSTDSLATQMVCSRRTGKCQMPPAFAENPEIHGVQTQLNVQCRLLSQMSLAHMVVKYRRAAIIPNSACGQHRPPELSSEHLAAERWRNGAVRCLIFNHSAQSGRSAQLPVTPVCHLMTSRTSAPEGGLCAH